MEKYAITISRQFASMGRSIAQELAEQLDHKGQVGIVAGDLKQKGHRERVEGFEEYMKSEPEMTVKFVESGYANLQMSEQKVRDLMGQLFIEPFWRSTGLCAAKRSIPTVR